MIDETVTIKCFLRIIFFWVRHHLRFFRRLSSREVSWSIDMYDSKGWEIEVIKNRKNFCKKNVEISFFNIGNILLLYLSVSNTTYFDVLKYLAKGWCRQIILRGTSIDIALNIQ